MTGTSARSGCNRRMSSGHVFVARGDMTKLVCDHVLVTTDYNLQIGKHWEPLLPPELVRPGWYMPLLR